MSNRFPMEFVSGDRGDDEELHDRYEAWREDRMAFPAGLTDTVRRGWQKNYFRGCEPGQTPFDDH